jgi:hypothetical protein
MKKIITYLFIYLPAWQLHAQALTGTVVEYDASMKMEMPIPGANVRITFLGRGYCYRCER